MNFISTAIIIYSGILQARNDDLLSVEMAAAGFITGLFAGGHKYRIVTDNQETTGYTTGFLVEKASFVEQENGLLLECAGGA